LTTKATATSEIEASAESGRTTQKIAQEETRLWILEHLREVMEISMQRVTSPKTLASDRIKWSRIAIGAGKHATQYSAT
jgi:hypothetical protein